MALRGRAGTVRAPRPAAPSLRGESAISALLLPRLQPPPSRSTCGDGLVEPVRSRPLPTCPSLLSAQSASPRQASTAVICGSVFPGCNSCSCCRVPAFFYLLVAVWCVQCVFLPQKALLSPQKQAGGRLKPTFFMERTVLVLS